MFLSTHVSDLNTRCAPYARIAAMHLLLSLLPTLGSSSHIKAIIPPIGLDPLWIPRPWLSHADSVSPARETGRNGPRRDRSPFYLDVDPGPFRFERITQPQGVDRARDPRADVAGSSPFDDVPQHACTAKRSYLCVWNKSRRKKGSSLVAAEPLHAVNSTATSQEKRAEESSDT